MKSFSFRCLFPPSRPKTVSFRFILFHFRAATRPVPARITPLARRGNEAFETLRR
jgi:hypothetical protein